LSDAAGDAGVKRDAAALASRSCPAAARGVRTRS
jgi:hypothetical protein